MLTTLTKVNYIASCGIVTLHTDSESLCIVPNGIKYKSRLYEFCEVLTITLNFSLGTKMSSSAKVNKKLYF